MGLSDKQDAVTSMLGVYVEAYLAHGDGYGDGDGDSDYMSEAADSEYDDGFYADGFGGGRGDADGVYSEQLLWLSGLAMSGPAFDDLIRWSVRDEFV